jgi:hypothetical protein
MHPRYPGPQLAAVPLIPPVEPNLVAATAEERERVKFAITLYDRQMANITKERALRDKWKLAQATGILTLQAALREQPEALLLIKTEENPFLAWDTLQTLYRGAVGGIVTDKGMIQVAKSEYQSMVFNETSPPSVQVAHLRHLQQQLIGTTSAITDAAFLDDVIARFVVLPLYTTTVELHQNIVGLTVTQLVLRLTAKFNQVNAAAVSPATGYYGRKPSIDTSGALPSITEDNNVFRKEKCNCCSQVGHNKHACRIWRADHPRDRSKKKNRGAEDEGIGMLAMSTGHSFGYSSYHWSTGKWLFILLLVVVSLNLGTALN